MNKGCAITILISVVTWTIICMGFLYAVKNVDFQRCFETLERSNGDVLIGLLIVAVLGFVGALRMTK